MMDFGISELEDTLDALDKNNIEYLGAGMKGAEAPHRLRYIARGTSASLINVAEQEFGVVAAGRAGVIKEDIASLYYWIKEEKTVSDFVIVIVHGGSEYFPLPSPERLKRARLYADFGADSVIYHHTHAISAYETYKGKPIFYGLGNFLFYWPGKGADWNTGMAVSLRLDVEHKRIIGEPFVHKYSPDDGVRMLSKQEADREFSCLDNLNMALADFRSSRQALGGILPQATPRLLEVEQLDLGVSRGFGPAWRLAYSYFLQQIAARWAKRIEVRCAP